VSTLWTPDGERPVGRTGRDPVEATTPPGRPRPGAADERPDERPVDPAAVAEQVEAMRAELARTPVEVVVANHCYGLFELAAVYLSQTPPLLPQARLAIDAMGCLVDGLGDRLGTGTRELRDGLSQLRLAFVQIDAAQRAGDEVAGQAPTNGSAGRAEAAGAEDPGVAGTDGRAGTDPAAG
jgi:hypothetical protein